MPDEIDGRGAETSPPRELPDDGEGRILITVAWVGTSAYVLTAAVATASSSWQGPMIVVSLVLFVVGLPAFMAAYLIAIGRSRQDAIGMGGLYFLAGTAPRRVQRHLLGAVVVQTLTAVVTASIGIASVQGDTSNPLAFGVLVPLFGLGLAGLWGARYGTFAPRPADQPRPARAPRQRPSEPPT